MALYLSKLLAKKVHTYPMVELWVYDYSITLTLVFMEAYRFAAVLLQKQQLYASWQPYFTIGKGLLRLHPVHSEH